MGSLPIRGGTGNDRKVGTELNDQRAELDVQGVMRGGRRKEERRLVRNRCSGDQAIGKFHSRQRGAVLVDDHEVMSGCPVRFLRGNRVQSQRDLLRNPSGDILIIVQNQGRPEKVIQVCGIGSRGRNKKPEPEKGHSGATIGQTAHPHGFLRI
jgi:hypothetical protein